MCCQVRSIWPGPKPWRAEWGKAWWLLCQPSPKVTAATQGLFIELSPLSWRASPQQWVAEFTSQVQW